MLTPPPLPLCTPTPRGVSRGFHICGPEEAVLRAFPDCPQMELWAETVAHPPPRAMFLTQLPPPSPPNPRPTHRGTSPSVLSPLQSSLQSGCHMTLNTQIRFTAFPPQNLQEASASLGI